MRELRSRRTTADRLGNIGDRRPPVGSPRLTTSTLTPRQPAAYTALVEALGEQPAGTVPCVSDARHLWLSDTSADQERAVEACRGCPVLDLCKRAGRGEHGGVWGGRLPPSSQYVDQDDNEEAA